MLLNIDIFICFEIINFISKECIVEQLIYFISNKSIIMLFLIINLTIGKYYPKFLTQFIFGCVIYIFLLFIVTDFISDQIYEKYKYYALSLFVIDVTYLIYKTKYTNMETIVQDHKNKSKIVFTDEKSIASASDQWTSELSKEAASPIVINGLSVTDSDNNNIFSASSVTETEKNSSSEKVTLEITE